MVDAYRLSNDLKYARTIIPPRKNRQNQSSKIVLKHELRLAKASLDRAKIYGYEIQAKIFGYEIQAKIVGPKTYDRKKIDPG